MYCVHCGAQVKDGSRFCTKCGKPLAVQTEVKPPKDEEKAEAAALPVEEPSTAAQPSQTPSSLPMPEEAAPAPVQNSFEENAPVYEAPVENAPTEETPAEEAPAPMPEAPVPDPTPAPVQPKLKKNKPPKKRAPKKKLGIVSILLSCLLCFLLFVAAIAASVVGMVRSTFSANSIEGLLDNIDLVEVDLLRDSKTGDEVELSKYVYAVMDDKMIDQYGITQKDVEKVIGDIEWKEQVSEITSGLIDSLLTGEEFEIEADDIVDIVRDNEDVMEKYMNGYKPDYDKLEKTLEKDVLPNFNQKSIVEDAKELIGFNPLAFLNVFSSTALIVLIAAAVIFILLIWVANRFRVLPMLSYVGMTFVVIGALQGVAGGVLRALIDSIGIKVLSTFLSPTLTTMLIVGICVFAVGIILFVLSKVLTAVFRVKELI